MAKRKKGRCVEEVVRVGSDGWMDCSMNAVGAGHALMVEVKQRGDWKSRNGESEEGQRRLRTLAPFLACPSACGTLRDRAGLRTTATSIPLLLHPLNARWFSVFQSAP